MTDVGLANIYVPGIGTVKMKKLPHSGSPQPPGKSFLECWFPGEFSLFGIRSVEYEAKGWLQNGQLEEYNFEISVLSQMLYLFLIKVKAGEFVGGDICVVLRYGMIGEAEPEKAQGVTS